MVVEPALLDPSLFRGDKVGEAVVSGEAGKMPVPLGGSVTKGARMRRSSSQAVGGEGRMPANDNACEREHQNLIKS